MKLKGLIGSTVVFVFVVFLFVYKMNSNLPVSDRIQSDFVVSAKNIDVPVLSEQIKLSLPIHIKIPKINVDANIESVGLAADGAVGVPKNQNNVAWFNLSSHPGENGNAIISGHYGWKDKKPSVFDNLYKLHKGDKISVEDDRGNVINFVVRGNRRYDPNANAFDVFISNDNKSHLNLITCEGVLNKNAKSYSKRLVVFADKEQ